MVSQPAGTTKVHYTPFPQTAPEEVAPAYVSRGTAARRVRPVRAGGGALCGWVWTFDAPPRQLGHLIRLLKHLDKGVGQLLCSCSRRRVALLRVAALGIASSGGCGGRPGRLCW